MKVWKRILPILLLVSLLAGCGAPAAAPSGAEQSAASSQELANQAQVLEQQLRIFRT